MNNSTDIPNVQSPLTLDKNELEPKFVETIRLILSAIICSIGIVGNLLVVIITGTNRANKTAVHKYILNLAIADIGVLAICYPLTLIKAADPFQWPLGKVFCEVFYPLSDIFYSASIGSIVAITIDRHLAIVRGMTSHRSLSVAKWVIMGVWVLGFLAVVVPLYFVMEFIDDKEKGTIDCTPVWPNNASNKSYVISLTIFWYLLPLALILWAYRQIGRKIRASKLLHKKINNMRGSYKTEKKKKFDKANTKALKILVPVVITFAVTMFPFHVFQIVSLFVIVRKVKYIWVVYNICTILLLSNSAANPIIYSLVSAEFRQRFKDIFSLNWQRLCQEPMKRKTDSSFSYRFSTTQVQSPNPDRETKV